MDCLTGLVGIRGVCTPDAPDSIYYINDLPGISIKEVSASMNSESKSAVDLINNKLEEAGNLIASRLQTLLQPRFSGGSVIQNGIVGYVQENQQTVGNQTGYLIGKHIEITGGEYLELFISRVGLHMVSTGSVSVYVYDLNQNKLLDTITVSAVAGEVSYVDVFKSYKGYGQQINLFIGYTYQASYKTILSRNNCTSCTGQVYSNPYIRFANRAIATGSSKIEENLVSGGDDGLILQYAVNCHSEPFICSIKHLLAAAIRWKAGELLVMEMVYSKRNNSYINIYGDDHAELLASYAAAYEAEIKNITQNMRIPDNICFSCNRKVKLETRI